MLFGGLVGQLSKCLYCLFSYYHMKNNCKFSGSNLWRQTVGSLGWIMVPFSLQICANIENINVA